MKANWEIFITHNAKSKKHEKSLPICFVYGRWAFFFDIETIILMTLFLMPIFSAGTEKLVSELLRRIPRL